MTLMVLAAAAVPPLLLAALGIPSLLGRPLPERVTGRLFAAGLAFAFAGLAGAVAMMAIAGESRIVIPVGEWFGSAAYHFRVRLLVDWLSLPLATFSAALLGVVSVFAHRYLHREPGYNRFFLLLALFAFGMEMIVLAGTIELIFAGWELVGLSSALLVAFFQDRPAPVANGFRTFVAYRATDVGLLVAAVLVHHFTGTGDLTAALEAPWTAGPATAVALLLVLSAMGKCAQLPFCGWLPRAMEGPTPSSAIFYGALSVHAGAFLLIRFGPLLERAPAAEALLAAVGLATALYATFVGRAQADVKTAVAYASLTQVSLILVEIAAGLRVIPVIHMVGHACVRSLQFLRAPNVLHDLRHLEAAVGGTPPRRGEHWAPARLYRWALDRGHLEEALEEWLVRPFLGFWRRLDRLERAWERRM